ncbi:hypothetical protein FRC12_009723 [Ceratobasidium sp. 428]|nr:hypothetical protein FRC12_009723 [Ceratobasidium sp. 428]
MPNKGKQKRELDLENAGDISISRAPAPPKKQKAVEPEEVSQPDPKTIVKTRSATKASSANDAGDKVVDKTQPVESVKIKLRPKLKQSTADPVSEPQDNSAAAPPPKAKKANASRQPTTAVQDDTEVAPPPPKKKVKQPVPPKEQVPKVSIKPNDDDAPAPLSPPESRKSSRAKKPSEIAEKVNEQVIAKQNVKDAKTAKKTKKVEATVIVETPAETAAALARLKGQSQPAPTSPALTSPPRKKKQVDRSKALDQLVNAQPFPSPDPSIVLGVSASTGSHTRTSSIAPSDSVSQTNAPKQKKGTTLSLQVPRSTTSSRDVSPTAPPTLSGHSSNAASRGVTPSADSAVTVDDDDRYTGSRVDINALQAGIPKPFNVGPALPPPELPKPIFTACLNPEVLQQATAGGKDKGKPVRSSIKNFRDEDKEHLKYCLEYMDVLVATVCPFPTDDMLWTFALLSNFWASKKLNRSYSLTRESEHFHLLSSRVSQSRAKFTATPISEAIRNHYPALHMPQAVIDGDDEVAKEVAEEEIRQNVAEMIESGSFLAPAKYPSLYFQNPYIGHVIKNVLWKGTTGKGFAPHLADFFSGISYSLLATAATAIERMLIVAASGSKAVAANHRNSVYAFSERLYAIRYDSHMTTIVQLHHSEFGQTFRDYLTDLHSRLTGKKAPVIIPSPSVRLTIPITAFKNYGQVVEAPPPAIIPSSSKRSVLPQARLTNFLEDPTLTKRDIIDAIFQATEEVLARRAPNSTPSSRQYEGLLTGANIADDNDDSEVKARRAGALPDTDNPGLAGQAWATESDQEMAEGASTGAGDKDEGEEGEEGDSSESETGDSKADTSMLEVDSSNEEDKPEAGDNAEGSADAGEGVDDAEETDEEEEDEDEANKARTRRLLSAQGAPLSSDGGDPETDGEGNSGAVVLPRNADTTMRSADDDDDDD